MNFILILSKIQQKERNRLQINVVFYADFEKLFLNFIKFTIKKCLFFHYSKVKISQNNNLIIFSSKSIFQSKLETKKPKQNSFGL